MGMPGPTEMLLILLVLVLLFGARKLPDLARGTGQALRIFKSETKGLRDDDENDEQSAADNSRSQLTSPRAQPEVTDPTAPTSAEASGSLPPTHTQK